MVDVSDGIRLAIHSPCPEVFSSEFDRYDRTLNTAEPPHVSMRPVRQEGDSP